MYVSRASATAQVNTHEGVVNVVINPDSINQLMDGAQGIETAVSGVNESKGIEAVMTGNGFGNKGASKVVCGRERTHE